MAYVPPSRTPVLNLGRGSEEPDDEPFSKGLRKLPPELRNLVYEHHFDSLGPVPSAHIQPDLTLVSRLIRQEALPVFYKRSTFEARLNIWTGKGNQQFPTTLSYSTDDMLNNISEENLGLISKMKLLLVFDMIPTRRFEVTFDLTQWHDFARAVSIERLTPGSEMKYEDIFMVGVKEAMEIVFGHVTPLEGATRVTCEQVLSVAETAMDEVFYYRDKEEWLDMAYLETLEALGIL